MGGHYSLKLFQSKKVKINVMNVSLARMLALLADSAASDPFAAKPCGTPMTGWGPLCSPVPGLLTPFWLYPERAGVLPGSWQSSLLLETHWMQTSYKKGCLGGTLQFPLFTWGQRNWDAWLLEVHLLTELMDHQQSCLQELPGGILEGYTV